MSTTSTTTDIAGHIERLDRDGYTIIEDAFDAALATELLADVHLGVASLLTAVQAARQFMSEGGRITATGSMSADHPWAGAASLGVQKAGLRNLVTSVDSSLKADGIRAASITVRGTLAAGTAFDPRLVAESIFEVSQRPVDGWHTEVPYTGRPGDES
jgi:NAD(P)-dependent dehydrogenase (short-subunit alcohol dehydrogenase family)